MKNEKVEKLVANLNDHNKKLHRIIKYNRNAWAKPNIDMNTDLRKKAKKDFCNLMNNAVFGKAMENVRKHRDIKLVPTKRRRNYLVSEPDYHTTKFFTENLLAIQMKKTEILIKNLSF